MIRIFGVILAVCVLICSFVLPSFAAAPGPVTSNGVEVDPNTGEPIGHSPLPAAKIETTTVTYAPTSFENMTKLAWALGAYRPDDVGAVNRFLQITECNLYHKFYQNEFEWTRILNRTKGVLQNNYGDDVPRFYEFVQPIGLERYDFKLKGFPLENRSVYEPTYMIQIADVGDDANSCGDKFPRDTKYPTSAAINLKSPFSLSFLHVPEDIAKEYLSYLERQSSSNNMDARPAYMRFQIEVQRVQQISTINNAPFFVFEGRLLRMDAFADKDLLLPLYTQKF